MTEIAGRERVAAVLFYGVLLLLAYLVFRIFEPFLTPLGWAVVFVVVFYPVHVKLERRLGPKLAAAVSTIAVTLILIVPAILLTTAFVREAVEAGRNIQTGMAEGRMPRIEAAWEWIQQRTPGDAPADLQSLAREYADRVGNFLATRAASVFRNIVLFVFYLIVTIFAMFFLFRDATKLVNGMRRLLPFEEPLRERTLGQARDLIFASVTASLIIAAVQGTLGGIAFAVVGIGAAVFWGVLMGFFSLVPLIGPWIVWVPAAIWLFASGERNRGIALVLLGLVVSTVDQFIRPALIKGRARLSALIVFISVLGGIGVFGMLGIVLGPIVVATGVGLVEAYTKEQEQKKAEAEARPTDAGAPAPGRVLE
jgi:predicted PurR-regulated permease PerM